MLVSYIWNAFKLALSRGSMLNHIYFLEILLSLFRPDIVDKGQRVRFTDPVDLTASYDYIVIGGGSAGSVLANRLSEIEQNTVLLLEAGGDEPLYGDLPSLQPNLVLSKEHTWKFLAEPSDNYCQGMKNKQCIITNGKGLGGTSAMHAMHYIRGNRRDYDHWEELGNPGWGYDDILPYFKKSEDNRIPEQRNSSYHGTDGYLTVERSKYDNGLTPYFLDAVDYLGYKTIDVNGEKQTGANYLPFTLRDGLRCSTAKGFLRSASSRKNLFVSGNSYVRKILIDEETKTAYGVEFRHKGVDYRVRANLEVILSAGALQSPKVLMLSGIGPAEHLKEVGVKVIHDSPGVGQNLADHIVPGGLIFTVDIPEDKTELAAPTLLTAKSLKDFVTKKEGLLYRQAMAEAVAFLNTKYADPSGQYPDIQLVYIPMAETVGDGSAVKAIHNLRDDFWDPLMRNRMDKRAFTLFPILLRPYSKGYVQLKNADADSDPKIVLNTFGDSRDINTIVDAMKQCVNITMTPAFQQFNARLDPVPIPGCAQLEIFSDEYFECMVRYYTVTTSHYSCTCRMGPASDKLAVVDSRLRVHGVNNLRVVDASVLPETPSGNTNAPTIMVAEKASDLIKEDQKNSVGY
ncbi:glucose dehydrogenase [FAD, quinone]-like [Athalia rosae]|uniref:glucose dehydrogenase [FAD, quinone]-like n=1 Tax=Athalia rosae TaxID=37344 RepID=UPI0020333CF7|nr:glucose dehydrogenase [FAD, quinone]-like [Athalia rosae]